MMPKLLVLLTAATFTAAAVGLHAEAEAMTTACSSSGIEIDWTYEGPPNTAFHKMPEAIQDGMAEQRRVLALPGDDHHQWPDCWWGHSSWGCQDGKMFCQCITVGGEWHCGCESGEC